MFLVTPIEAGLMLLRGLEWLAKDKAAASHEDRRGSDSTRSKNHGPKCKGDLTSENLRLGLQPPMLDASRGGY
jgi:hypothetical protein